MQDIQSSCIAITVNQKDIVAEFKKVFYHRLRHCIDSDDNQLIHYVYGPI
jgi:hypothetical protein